MKRTERMIHSLALLVSIFELYSVEGFAFRTCSPTRRIRQSGYVDNTLKAQQQDQQHYYFQNDEQDDCKNIPRTAAMTGISRRDAINFSLIATTGTAIVTTTFHPQAANGYLGGGATQSARVEAWPGIDTLEPMYEFKLSLDAIVSGLQDTKNWPYIKKRLDQFFGGFIVNEKNFYFGVGLQYMNEIKYDKLELPNYVLLDKQSRYNALESTMNNLENLKNNLGLSGIDPTTIADYANLAQSSLTSWFDLIPEEDVKAVEDLFIHVKKADINRDGRLSDDELAFLSPIEQEIWKKRVSKFG